MVEVVYQVNAAARPKEAGGGVCGGVNLDEGLVDKVPRLVVVECGGVLLHLPLDQTSDVLVFPIGRN